MPHFPCPKRADSTQRGGYPPIQGDCFWATAGRRGRKFLRSKKTRTALLYRSASAQFSLTASSPSEPPLRERDFEPRGRTCPPTQVMSPNPRPPTPRSPSTGSAVEIQLAGRADGRVPTAFVHGAGPPVNGKLRALNPHLSTLSPTPYTFNPKP